MNVLIDDNEQAVLCDFGLSRLKADVTSRTTILGTTAVAGTRNWMAPERLKGGSIKKPADIYAFGMVVYEVKLIWYLVRPSLLIRCYYKIYTNKTPLGHIEYRDFLELVVGQDMRPERPHARETPKLCDDAWNLARRCWVKDPLLRPTADGVCETISHLLENGGVVSESQLDGGLDTPTARTVVLPQPIPVAG
jgi:serine/threonine protein kinase